MIASTDEHYYRMLIQDFIKDPRLAAEYSTLALQESLVCIHPKGGLKLELILFLVGWLSDLAISMKRRT